MKLDKEEKAILDAYDKGTMKTSAPSKKELDETPIKFCEEPTFVPFCGYGSMIYDVYNRKVIERGGHPLQV